MADRITKDAVEFAWRQWTALGVRGVAPIPDDAIDLEALIAFTPTIAAAEPRLAAEARDWCVRIGPGFVSVSRLKQLLGWFPDAKPHALIAETIDAALRKRPSVKTSGKSRQPELGRPALLSLRARRVFGVGARADLVVALLRRRDHDGVVASDLATLGYSKRTIASLLDDLASAGVADRRSVRNTATFSLARDQALADLLAPIPKRIPSWLERFAIVAAVLAAARTATSPVSHAVELNHVLDRVAPLVQSLSLKAPIARGPDAVIAAVDRWANDLLRAG